MIALFKKVLLNLVAKTHSEQAYDSVLGIQALLKVIHMIALLKVLL
jgi:hypothetical protein